MLSGYRAPWIVIFEATLAISRRSSGVSLTASGKSGKELGEESFEAPPIIKFPALPVNRCGLATFD